MALSCSRIETRAAGAGNTTRPANPPIWYQQKRGLAVDATRNEVWLPVDGQDVAYEVSSLGRVRSLPRVVKRGTGTYSVSGRILRPFKGDADGHQVISFGKRNRHYVHLLVLEAFVGPRPDGLEGCHNDGDPTNNRASNLRWDTPSSNQLDRVKHGTHHYARRTHCKHGHEYTPENTSWRIRVTGPKTVTRARECMECRRMRNLAA